MSIELSNFRRLMASFCVFAFAVLLTACVSQGQGVQAQDDALKPDIKGTLKGEVSVGEKLHEDNFENLDRWSVQVQSSSADSEPKVHTHDNKLDAFVPDRGATIWFRRKLEGPVAIMYQVRCPKNPDTPGAVPRDINNFWHMTARPDAMLSGNRYNGGFGGYHELEGYYSSTGGRGNTTTRFRRYPRELRGHATGHIALNHRDNKDPYLITPEKTHTVQLVAVDGTAQYIVDGKLVYEIVYGDTVRLKTADGNFKEVKYTRDRFPAYKEGFFGFRLTTTHHIYSNFHVYRLNNK